MGLMSEEKSRVEESDKAQVGGQPDEGEVSNKTDKGASDKTDEEVVGKADEAVTDKTDKTVVSKTDKVALKDQKRRNFILNGNLLAVVLGLSAPLILLNIGNYIYGIIDTIVVAGHGSNVLSSVVMVTQLKNLLTTLGGGLATGGTIIVSRYIGRNDYESAKKSANTYIVISAVISVVLVAIILPFARGILIISGFSEDLIEVGIDYFIVQIFSVGIHIFNTTFLGLEKARGATKNVLYINLVVMAVKIMLTLLFVYRLNLDTTWIAASTLFANLIITAYAIIQLARKGYLFHFSFKNTNFKGVTVKPYLRLSLPVFIGSFVFSLGKVIVNALGTRYGDDAPGALGVSNNLSGSVTTITSSTEESISMIVSQNVGAGNAKRATNTFWIGLAVDVVISLIGVIILASVSDWAVSFFDNGNQEYHDLIKSILMLEMSGIVMLGVNAASLGFIYGLGYTKLSLVFNISRLFVLRLPVVIIMVTKFHYLGAVGLGWAMFVSNVGVGIVAFILAIICLIKIKRKGINDKL
jgi:putative MATE family efflux protein